GAAFGVTALLSGEADCSFRAGLAATDEAGGAGLTASGTFSGTLAAWFCTGAGCGVTAGAGVRMAVSVLSASDLGTGFTFGALSAAACLVTGAGLATSGAAGAMAAGA